MRYLFFPGRVFGTPGIRELISQGTDISSFLKRHLQGDWGDISDEDKESNNGALISGERIISAYFVTPEIKIWIVTDGGMTTIMFPSEY
ncbi:hypothetical protein EC412_05230 [Salmonella enterica subsp. enterica serovar Redlands]|nr:hypothetical protein [Salmonella enterica subsp. enterica serovar Redlands]